MLSPLIVFLGSQLFKGEFWLSTNKLLLAVHNNLLNVSSGRQRGLCRVSWLRNHDHPLFPVMGKIILFTTLYKSSSWWKLRNRLMYLHIWLFITLWRCYFRSFWTLKRQKRKKHKHSLTWKKTIITQITSQNNMKTLKGPLYHWTDYLCSFKL